MSDYLKILADLQKEIHEEGARPNVIDDYLERIISYGDRRITMDLLLLLSDKAQYDEGMFSIVHAAEAADDPNYVEALLAVFSEIMRSAPRWTSIVLMRALNSRPTQLEIVKQLRSASQKTKDAVCDMCERINGVSPEFLSKTIPVTLAARS